MTEDAPSATRLPGIVRRGVGLLRSLSPFWLLNTLLIALLATGLGIAWVPRFRGLAWSLTEAVHVTTGWVVIPVFAGYLVHHLVRRWGSFRVIWRLLGVVVALAALAALVSGVALEFYETGGEPTWMSDVHLATSLVMAVALLLHTSGAWRR